METRKNPMTKITKFDKRNIDAVSREMKEACQAIAEKYGINIRCAGGRFDPIKATLKFEVKVADTQSVDSVQRLDFMNTCRLYGLKATDYRRPVKNPLTGKTYMPVGFNHSRSKNVLSLFCVDDGKTYMAPQTWNKLWKSEA